MEWDNAYLSYHRLRKHAALTPGPARGDGMFGGTSGPKLAMGLSAFAARFYINVELKNIHRIHKDHLLFLTSPQDG
jgi:hypothetical protein